MRFDMIFLADTSSDGNRSIDTLPYAPPPSMRPLTVADITRRNGEQAGSSSPPLPEPEPNGSNEN